MNFRVTALASHRALTLSTPVACQPLRTRAMADDCGCFIGWRLAESSQGWLARFATECYCSRGMISFLKRLSELTTLSWLKLPMWNMPIK